MGWEKEPQKVDTPVVPETGQGVKTMPCDIDLNFDIAKAVKEGRILNDREKEYVYDKIDHYKLIANKYNFSTETEKILTMFETDYPEIESEGLKKSLEYKNRDGSPIAKGKDKYSFGEEIVFAGELLKEYFEGKNASYQQKAVNYVFNFGMNLHKAKKESHETGVSASEIFNRLMEKVEAPDFEKMEKGRGR